MFVFEGCLVRNQPESVLKMFLNLVSEFISNYILLEVTMLFFNRICSL